MEIKIDKKPFSINSNARILYKIIQILLILHLTGRGKNKTTSILKIHLLVWVLQVNIRKDNLLNSKEHDYQLSIGIWSIDRNTNEALTYLVEDGLCKIDGKEKKNYSITENGKNLIQKIIKDETVFISTIEFLNSIGNSLNEKNVKTLQELWEK
jgi:hypothetical protein